MTGARCPLCNGKLIAWNTNEPWRCVDCGAQVHGPILAEPEPAELEDES